MGTSEISVDIIKQGDGMFKDFNVCESVKDFVFGRDIVIESADIERIFDSFCLIRRIVESIGRFRFPELPEFVLYEQLSFSVIFI